MPQCSDLADFVGGKIPWLAGVERNNNLSPKPLPHLHRSRSFPLSAMTKCGALYEMELVNEGRGHIDRFTVHNSSFDPHHAAWLELPVFTL
jgi:hypothetical protein